MKLIDVIYVMRNTSGWNIWLYDICEKYEEKKLNVSNET